MRKFLSPEDAPSRARRIVKKGTVIYSTVRPYLLNTAIVEEEFVPQAIVSTAFAVLHPYSGIIGQYLHYYLRSKFFTRFVESQMSGMAYPAISDSKLQMGLVPIPPTTGQRTIVETIKHLMSQCDETERIQQDKSQLRVTLNSSALTHLVEAKEPKTFAIY